MVINEAETKQLKLHRNLSIWEAIGISLALMAPSMAASINPQGTATTVGRATPSRSRSPSWACCWWRTHSSG